MEKKEKKEKEEIEEGVNKINQTPYQIRDNNCILPWWRQLHIIIV